MRWLKPRLVVTIDYLECTATNHLRHSKFAGIPKIRSLESLVKSCSGLGRTAPRRGQNGALTKDDAEWRGRSPVALNFGSSRMRDSVVTLISLT
jgi:hypothetical protein